LLMSTITDMLVAKPVKKKKSQTSKFQKPSVFSEQDLRRIVAEGQEKELSAYDSLLAARMVKPPVLDFAA